MLTVDTWLDTSFGYEAGYQAGYLHLSVFRLDSPGMKSLVLTQHRPR
jgi:hypothetical protein